MPEPPTFLMRFCRWTLRLFGWRIVCNVPDTPKFVVIGAWHTSNWDFPVSVLAAGGMGLPLNFIGKKELTEGRMGWLMKRLGVIGIDRQGRAKVVEQVVKVFEERNAFIPVIAAEGTRSQAEYWRTGFYYIALAANVPIAFGFLNAEQKEIGINGYFMPTGDREDDLTKVKAFYQNMKGLKPEKQGEIKFRPVVGESSS